MSERLAKAVRNNAEWCASVCATHGEGGRFGFAAWSQEEPAPHYYPNLVTLRADCASAQIDEIGHLARRLPAGWGVKDSFANLDLTPLGFEAAISGEWVDYPIPETGAALDWRPVDDPMALQAWEIAWGGENHRGHRRIFAPALLDSSTFLAGFWRERLVAGGVVTMAAGVAGLSNVFSTLDTSGMTDAVVHQAHRVAGEAPLVGWRRVGEADGGRSLGPLRVWLKARD
jgi:hypothetical protein